jgi:hypothetical protein
MRTYGTLTLYNAGGIVPPSVQIGTAAGTVALTRNALGDWSWNNVAGIATFNFIADNSIPSRPPINFPYMPGQGTVPLSNEFQEAFGTAAGGPTNPFSGINPILSTLPASVEGSGVIPWGIALIDIFAIYSVQTAALTAATISVSRNIFVENTLTVITPLVAAQAIATTTTTSATTPHVQKFTLPQPLVFETADFSSLTIELAITTAATSALRVYGIGAHYAMGVS